MSDCTVHRGPPQNTGIPPHTPDNVVASCLRGERIQALVHEHWKYTLAIPEGAGNSSRGLSLVATALGDFGAEGCVAAAGREDSCSETAVFGPRSRAFGRDGAVLSNWGLHQVGSVCRLNGQGWRWYLKSMIHAPERFCTADNSRMLKSTGDTCTHKQR